AARRSRASPLRSCWPCSRAPCSGTARRANRSRSAPMIALVATVAGTFSVDLEEGDVEPAGPFEPAPAPALNLPRVVAAAAAGPTVVALLDAKPPLLVSYDAGTTWRGPGRGLPPGRAVAVSET